MTKVLIVDDEPNQLKLTEEMAKRAGFDVISADNGQEALSILRTNKSIKAIILDLIMPNLDGMAVLEKMRKEDISTPVIVQTAKSSMELIITAMRLGAVDYFVKPVSFERLAVSLQNAIKLEHLENCIRNERTRRAGTFCAKDIISKSPAMNRVIKLIEKAAKSNIAVLIEGEAGTGKELIARAIQGSSDRRGRPFISVNCAAIAHDQIESILFGYEKGAFVGANSGQKGKFEEANGGTIFLQEVGELPPAAQLKLLRIIQNGQFEPVGSFATKKVNVRIISSTTKRLLNIAQTGAFREDLFYSLNVFPIYVPPLRDRKEDIIPLTEHFMARFGAESGLRIYNISDETKEMLLNFNWPNNIRQLENAVFRAVVLAEGTCLRPADFPQINLCTSSREQLRKATIEQSSTNIPVHIDDNSLILRKENIVEQFENEKFLGKNGEITPLAELEKELIKFALKRYKGHMSQIARSLKIGRSTLYRKLKEYGLAERNEQNVA